MEKRRILLAEDKEEIRSNISEIISDEGYEVVTAVDGEQALEFFQGSIFLVVITDIGMPKKDGIEILEEIKKHHPPTRVIIITAEGGYDEAVKALNLDAERYIDKGNAAFFDELISAVKSAFDKAEAQVEAEQQMLSYLTHTLRSSLSGGPETVDQILRLSHKLIGEKYQEPEIYKITNNLASLYSIFTSVENMLKTYKFYVTEPSEINRKWQEDVTGSMSLEYLLSLVLKQGVSRILFEESNLAQFRSLVAAQTSQSMKDVRESFLNEVLLAEGEGQDAYQVLAWLARFFPVTSLNVRGSDVQFDPDGIRFNLLFAILSEIIYNSLKYTDSGQPFEIEWNKQGQQHVFSCRNRFSPDSTKKTGSQKGLAFVKALTKTVVGITFSYKSENNVFSAQLYFKESALNRKERYENSLD